MLWFVFLFDVGGVTHTRDIHCCGGRTHRVFNVVAGLCMAGCAVLQLLAEARDLEDALRILPEPSFSLIEREHAAGMYSYSIIV